MLRRRFLSAMGLATPSTLLIGGTASGKAAPHSAAIPQHAGAVSPATVGPLNLDDLPVIDVHMHPPQELTHTEGNERWLVSFVDALVPAGDYPGKAEHRARVTASFRYHYLNNPKEVGLRDYVGRAYGVEPTIEAIDAIAARHIAANTYADYVCSVMDREKITGILLQSASTEPVRPQSLIPDERMQWSYSINHMLAPQWAREQNLAHIDDLVSAMHRTLEQCVRNGCRGFKTSMAYFRPLQFDDVTAAQAAQAFKHLLSVDASRAEPIHYQDEQTRRALKAYQDYLYKQIVLKTAALQVNVIIHTAVALHPALQTANNSPVDLYHLFQNDEVRRAEAQFVLIHSGYPNHHHIATFLSQFPNVYTDVSFYASCAGTLEEVLRAFLGLASSEKIMHGTDWNDPEVWGYSAFNVRRALARVLNEYRTSYGWSQRHCETAATNILSENARRVYGFA